MQKPFITQPELFVSTNDLDHLALHALDDTEAVLDWSKIEPILSSIHASKTGCPSYPLETFFMGFFWVCGIGCRTFSCHSAFIVTCYFVSFAILG
jgi:hypothetical protein